MPKTLPRVATLTHAQRPATRGGGSTTDRFAGHDSLYKTSDAPSAIAYASSSSSTLGKGPSASFGLGPSDRFAGHGSRYKKGLRNSTMPIHDPKVYEAKQVADSVPMPAVAVNLPVAEKRDIVPSNERFGAASFYATSDAPAPTKYDAASAGTIAASSSHAGVGFDKSGPERFVGQDSVYAAAYNGAPAVTKYDPTTAEDTVKSATSSFVMSFESGYTDRFAGPDSRYKRGLRRSTVPEQRDPTSFPKGIGKSSGAARSAALKAALKATISDASKLGAVSETLEEEAKENLVEA